MPSEKNLTKMNIENLKEDMTLKEFRAKSEKSCNVVQMVVSNEPIGKGGLYVRVFVITKSNDIYPNTYSLRRYFIVGSKWQVSVDISHGTIEECMKEISKEMEEIHPDD